MTGDILIRVDDLRKSGVCPKASAWFEKQGLDWRDFVRNGISGARLVATGDAIAVRVVEEAQARKGAGNGRL